MQRQQKYNFLRHVFLVEQTKGEIKKYQERLEAAIKSFQVCLRKYSLLPSDAFQVSSLINIQRWQYKSERAMAADRKALNDRLNSLQSNQDKLVDLLSTFSVLLAFTAQVWINHSATTKPDGSAHGGVPTSAC